MSKYQQPVWRRNDNVARGHRKYDEHREAVERWEGKRQEEIIAAYDRAGSGLHHLTDRELHHLGFTRTRGIFGNITGIVPRDIHQERLHTRTAERRGRQQDRRQARRDTAKRVVKRAVLGQAKPKTRLLYWGKANKYK